MHPMLAHSNFLPKNFLFFSHSQTHTSLLVLYITVIPNPLSPSPIPTYTTMTKKGKATYQKRDRNDNHVIDNIAKYSQQRRSPGGSKRRTDFSLFFSSSTLPDLSLDSPSSKEILTTVTVSSSDEINDTGMKESSSDSDDETSDSARILEFTPKKSQITENNNVCITPGSVVWAKAAEQCWWPAQVLGEKLTVAGSSTQCIDGQTLVQYYGKNERAWVDPARDLSLFEECFEERSCNLTEDFQNALKQALYCKEQLQSSKELFASPDEPDCSNQLDQSPDKGNSSSSSRAGCDNTGRGRSKRERKPIARFDEATYPLKSVKKVRRVKIMRFLGLAAPVGSPFLSPGNVRVTTE